MIYLNCAARATRPITALIALLRGEPGYFLWVEGLPPEEWNKANDISPDQVKVMMECSMFGWPMNSPKADTQLR